MKIGNHIIAIYPDIKCALNEAFAFLKKGLDQGEVVMLITHALTKDETLDRMSEEWNVDARKLVDYECDLEPQFEFPLTAVCAYTIDDISSLSAEIVDRLQDHHAGTWA